MKIQIKKSYSVVAKLGLTLGSVVASLYAATASADALTMTGPNTGIAQLSTNISQAMASLGTPIFLIAIIFGISLTAHGLFKLYKATSGAQQSQGAHVPNAVASMVIGATLLSSGLLAAYFNSSAFGSNAGTDSNVNYVEQHINDTQGGKL